MTRFEQLEQLARVEAILDGIVDIDPTDPYEVGLLEMRDELCHQLNKEQQ